MILLKFVPLSETVSVAGQISPVDMQEIAQAGFKSIVCNRPDGESPGCSSSQELATAASRVGLTMAYLPVVSGRITASDGREFSALLNQLPTPVLAYCRSGLRSATLWALSQANTQVWPELVHHVARAGFNLSGVTPPTRT